MALFLCISSLVHAMSVCVCDVRDTCVCARCDWQDTCGGVLRGWLVIVRWRVSVAIVQAHQYPC